MIKSEIVEICGNKFKKTFSDKNLKIKKSGTNKVYDEAVDLLTAQWQYEETDEKIEIQEVGT
jgi:hypothetical protein